MRERARSRHGREMSREEKTRSVSLSHQSNRTKKSLPTFLSLISLLATGRATQLTHALRRENQSYSPMCCFAICVLMDPFFYVEEKENLASFPI